MTRAEAGGCCEWNVLQHWGVEWGSTAASPDHVNHVIVCTSVKCSSAPGSHMSAPVTVEMYIDYSSPWHTDTTSRVDSVLTISFLVSFFCSQIFVWNFTAKLFHGSSVWTSKQSTNPVWVFLFSFISSCWGVAVFGKSSASLWIAAINTSRTSLPSANGFL